MPLIQGNTKDDSVTLQAANNLFINSVGDEMSGNLNMKLNSITNLGDAVNNSDAVNKKYVDAIASTLTTIRNNYDGIHYIHSQSIQANQLSIDEIKPAITSINSTINKLTNQIKSKITEIRNIEKNKAYNILTLTSNIYPFKFMIQEVQKDIIKPIYYYSQDDRNIDWSINELEKLVEILYHGTKLVGEGANIAVWYFETI